MYMYTMGNWAETNLCQLIFWFHQHINYEINHLLCDGNPFYFVMPNNKKECSWLHELFQKLAIEINYTLMWVWIFFFRCFTLISNNKYNNYYNILPILNKIARVKSEEKNHRYSSFVCKSEQKFNFNGLNIYSWPIM